MEDIQNNDYQDDIDNFDNIFRNRSYDREFKDPSGLKRTEKIGKNSSYTIIFFCIILLEIRNQHRCSDSVMNSFLKIIHLLVDNCILPKTWKTVENWLKKQLN